MTANYAIEFRGSNPILAFGVSCPAKNKHFLDTTNI